MTEALNNLIASKVAADGGLINKLEQPLLLVMVLVIMFGMGATLRWSDFRTALKNPKGILVGFLSQFGIMPLIGYLLSVLLDLDPRNAIALILVGCLPAGSTSNMFSYFSRGDVALSISMTAASTLAAIIMTPLLLALYASGFAANIDPKLVGGAAVTAETFKIPYANIVVSLVLVLLPVIGGMILLKKSPAKAKIAEDTAGFVGIVVILFLVISSFSRHGDLLFETPWQVYLASILVGLGGFQFGYWFSWLLKSPARHRRTIALETGIQNGPLAFAIVIASFAEPLKSQLLWLPILYSTFIVISSSVITLIFRRMGRNDWELYENQQVQERLLGKAYASKEARG